MKITVIGTGYVGLVTGACFADHGNDVFCLDVDSKKIEFLDGGGLPIHEPGLRELVERNRRAERIRFSTDVGAAVAHGEVLFIAVGTPADEDGSADLQYVLAAARQIGAHITGFKVVVDKSTVPVGTAEQVHEVIAQGLAARRPVEPTSFVVVSNPEFLKEGAAIDDFMRPDRIVLGVDESTAEGRRACELIRRLYAPLTRNHERLLVMDVRSAELTKYAANAMLATRVSFMNEMANLADAIGADIEQVRRGIGSDPRIGRDFLYAGTGYGGSCFPKDIDALLRTAEAFGKDASILRAVRAVNDHQKHVLVSKITARYGEQLEGRVFALWGLAFKPNTDDMRGAPSRIIVRELVRRGAKVRVNDPVAMDEARRCLDLDLTSGELAAVSFLEQPYEALRGADALIIVTEWKAYRSPDFEAIRSTLREPVIFDGRNLYEPRELAHYGFCYYGVGRESRG